MGTRKQYGDMYISKEDRGRLARSRFRATIAESGNPGMSVITAIEALEDDVALLAELREKYEIPADESVGFSLLDGMVLDIDEEL